jgi:predicted PurR-regulated permease PerM
MSLFSEQRVQAGIWIGVGLAILVLLYVLAPVLTPFALGAILAYLLVPGVDWLQKRRVPRAVGALIMLVLLLLVVVGLLLILIPVLQREVLALYAALPGMVTRLNTTVAPAVKEWFGWSVQFDFATLKALLSEQVGQQQDLVARLLDRVRAGGAAIAGLLGLLLLVPVVLFYLLVDWHDLKTRIEVLIPRRLHTLVTGMLAEIDGLLAQFLRGQLSVMLALAAYYSLTLAIAGFQTALPIGILTGVLIFIPYVGFMLGLLLALLAAFLQFSSWYGLIAVGIIYGVGQIIESFLLTPRLVGERIGLHPLAVIFALLAFGEVFGFFGVLVALPASAALLVALKRVRTAYLTSDFYKQP